MPREQSPAFQFYPQDFVSDPKVLAMTSAARGAYIMLLCHCWTNGSVPDDDIVLRRISAYDGRDWRAACASVRACLGAKDGKLFSPRLERERQKQADYREMKARAGQAGGQQTASRRAAAMAAESSPPSLSSSLSSSSSLIPRIEEQAKETVLLSTTKKNGSLTSKQKEHGVRLAAARAMDRPWQKDQRRSVHRHR